MGRTVNNTGAIMARIQKGWKPKRYLTNMSMAFFAADNDHVEIKLAGRRIPNKLSLGYDSYIALKNHPDILERVKYGGSTPNPATVNQNVLAQILGFEEVQVLEATYNKAEEGQEDDIKSTI